MSRFYTTPTRATRRRTLLGTLVLAATLVACQDTPPPSAPAGVSAAKGGSGKPGATETVLFSGVKNGVMDIYAMNPDGSNVRRITADSAEDMYPDFAPDNRRFVWVRHDRFGANTLLTANVDGSKQTVLMTSGTFMGEPRFSPDGTKIAFVLSVPDSSGEVFVINADGSNLTRLTFAEGDDRAPAWSPDGQRIAFASDRTGAPSLYSMTPSGQDVKYLLDCGALSCGNPVYSPDGNRVAFTNFADGTINVYAFNGPQSITAVGPSMAGVAFSWQPAWTKDGTRVVFASNRGIEGTLELYVGTPGNSGPTSVRRLTVFSPGKAWTPTYSH